ncbi:hypothetical protein RB6444 [Rhodopirellula baltica SH 1]|uniref:Uncharacterized protein n=1 Tax=Rhodopirellula baltica (strain DSM 10527 / NCIMB 13988 / SH1) TaxID=243090 RepID=Q7UQ98_RHOBA|nr:hypothetical protein RB6444 [Rhodopirellula baltica SH 1]
MQSGSSRCIAGREQIGETHVGLNQAGGGGIATNILVQLHPKVAEQSEPPMGPISEMPQPDSALA